MANGRRTFFQRVLGKPATPAGAPEVWRYEAPTLRVSLPAARALAAPGGALRLEGPALPHGVLVVHGIDHRFRAYRNACGHGGRCVDPLPGEARLECCSLGRSTYDYDGRICSGPAHAPLHCYPARIEGEALVVELDDAP